jgi:RHS repeat-associated protein
MLNHVRSCLVIAVLLLASPIASHAQVTTGTPPFSDITGSPDKVDLGNLNVHLPLPIFHKAGRGLPFSFDFGNDSSLWVPVASNGTTFWEPRGTFGWVGSGTNIGTIGATIISGSGFFEYCLFTYLDGFGTPHVFPGCAVVDTSGDFPLASSTVDGSGYTLKADGCGILQNNVCFLVFSLTTVDGNSIIPQNATPVIGSSGASSGSIIDRNGNQITANSNGTFTDMLGITTLTNSGGFPPNPNNLNPPPAPSPFVMSYTSPAGTAASAKLTYKLYTIRTNFGCSGIVEFGASTQYSNYLPDRITLADGSFYQFQYEPTPGIPTDVTGRLSSVTLPTGGKTTYAYTGANNGILCSDGSTSGLTRTTLDGAWTYARTQGVGTASTTVVTDPQGNQTVVQFQGIYETQKNVYQGLASNGTLLQTIFTCYNGSASPCNGTAIALPITQKSVITQLGSLQMKKVYTFPSDGSSTLLEEDDYDYGSGAPGALLKKTLYSYASLGAIKSFPATITVCTPGGTSPTCNGSGTPVLQTTNKYDETPVVTTTATPQLVNVGTSPRGNVTSTQALVQGTTTLTKHFTYFDTGNLQTITDTNGAQTTYVYGSGSCGNSFPTSINEPLGLSKSMIGDCIGGVQTTAIDENGQKITTSYTDPFFWRVASVTDAAGATSKVCHGLLTNGTCTVNPNQTESTLSFNSNNSTIDKLTTTDGLGRRSLQQIRQSPGAGNFDSTETDFDSLGRPHRTTLPYSATANQTNSSAPALTTTYDALGRILAVTDAGGGSTSNNYNQNDVLVTTGPAPAGESIKQRQLEYDGLGRLTSTCEITNGAGSGTCGQTVARTGYWTRYAYDVLGNLIGVTQNAQAGTAQRQTRSYAYDGLSRLNSETNPESGATTYTHDTDATCGASFGDKVKRVDAVGNITCYAYDARHRNTSITYSGPYAASTPNRYFVYDAATIPTTPTPTTMANTKSRLAEAYTATCQTCTKLSDVGFSYSARGEVLDIYELTAHSGGYYHLNEVYWSNGVPSQLSGNIGLPALNYGVDGEGRTNSTSTSTQTLVSGVTYNIASQPTQLNLGTGDSDALGYDANTMRMTQYKFNVDAQSVVGNLTWNANATLQQLAIADPFNASNNQTCTYGYDDLKRVSGVSCTPPGSSTPSTWQQSFSYDPFGNISKSGSMSFQPTYTDANGHTLNRYTSVPGCVVSYDANGNVLNDCLHTYTWNVEGRPVTADGVSLTFDALSRMVEQNRSGAFTQIVYAPTGEKVALMSGQTLQRGYVPLPGQLTAVYTSAGISYYRHKDWLGSSRFASTTTPAATGGMGTGTVNGGEQSVVLTSPAAGTGSVTLGGSEQSTAGGPGTPGSGTVTIAGFERSKFVCDPTLPGCNACRLRSCGMTVFDSGVVRITVNGHTDSASYLSGSTSVSVASALANAINADSTSFVTASVNGSVITLTAKTSGSITNYSLSTTAATNDPTNFSGSSFSATPSAANLTGGTNSTQVFDSGNVLVTVNGCQISVPYQQGSTTATLVSALSTAINGSSCSPVNTSTSNLTVTVTAKTTGAATNYSLSGGSATNQPGSFAHPSFTVTPSGTTLTGGTNGTFLFDTGTASITVNGIQTTVGYGQNDSRLTVATALTNAVNASSTVPVKASVSGSLIVLTAKTPGASTNYSLSASSSTSQSTKFSQPSFQVAVSGPALTGGSASATTMHSSTAYAPFGENYAVAGTADVSFAGLNSDTVGGLYDASAREYSIQGRWPSPDPAGLDSIDATDPQTWNRYAYVADRPTILSDTSGKDPCDFDPSCGGGGGFGGDCTFDPSCGGGFPGGGPIWSELPPWLTGPTFPSLPNPIPNIFNIPTSPVINDGWGGNSFTSSGGSGGDDCGWLWPFSSWCKAKKLKDQTETDKAIFDMTSPFLFMMDRSMAATDLGIISEIERRNLMIDAVLDGAPLSALRDAYPEVLGPTMDAITDSLKDGLQKIHDQNNQEIDRLLGEAGKSLGGK